MRKKVALVLLLLVVLYLSVGVWFHVQEKRHWNACREQRIAKGEFVEPEMYPVLGVVFDMTYWPVYMWANKYNFGSVFGKECG